MINGSDLLPRRCISRPSMGASSTTLNFQRTIRHPTNETCTKQSSVSTSVLTALQYLRAERSGKARNTTNGVRVRETIGEINSMGRKPRTTRPSTSANTKSMAKELLYTIANGIVTEIASYSRLLLVWIHIIDYMVKNIRVI